MSGMIVAPQPTAVEEGAKVLMRGGNAIDAAVTAAFVQFVIDPHTCSVGGYMVSNVHLAHGSAADDNPFLLDGPAVAGSKVKPDMWQDIVIRPNPDGWGYFLKGNVNDLGYQSICTPGAIKGLSALLDRGGTISWKDALQPAIKAAEEGFIVSSELAARWKEPAAHPEASSARDAIQSNAEARRIYLKSDGSLYEAGDRLRNPDYAKTLTRLAAAGAEDFYQGELAERMSRDLAANDAFVTAEDFAAYRLREPQSVRGNYRGHGVASSQSPREKYCQWLSKPPNDLAFALPTEAQWEYACGAGTITAWHCGDSEVALQEYGWFSVNSGGKTHSVGQLRANGFGLYDMHGNVREWCADLYAADYYATSPVSDPTGRAEGSHRVNRGGCWTHRASSCRSAYRHDSAPDYRYDSLGFRPASVQIEKYISYQRE